MNKQNLINARRLTLAFAPLALLAACGGSDHHDAPPPPPINSTTPNFTAAATVFGEAAMMPQAAGSYDLALQSNRVGEPIALRFNCDGCRLEVSAQGHTGTQNQDVQVAFDSLNEGAFIPVDVRDLGSGARFQYRLMARPADAFAYQVKTSGTAEPGSLYVTPWSIMDASVPSKGYAYQIGADGSLLYYRKAPDGQVFSDFKKTTLPDGSIRYSLFEGPIVNPTPGSGAIRILDANFKPLALVKAIDVAGVPNRVDAHDHILIDANTQALLTFENRDVSDVPSRMGMATRVGAAGIQVIQNGALAFSWSSADHPELYACSSEGNNFNATDYADYAHVNSLKIDADGDFIASFRHLDAVVKIRRADGSIAWILGGACDQFGLASEQKFSHQHDAKRAPDGRLSLFDNGNAPGNVPGVSRALLFNLDEANKTLVATDPAKPAFAQAKPGASLSGFATPVSVAMGSATFFPSGKTLVGWGAVQGKPGVADVTEFDAATGAVDFELNFPNVANQDITTYRAVKFQ